MLHLPDSPNHLIVPSSRPILLSLSLRSRSGICHLNSWGAAMLVERPGKVYADTSTAGLFERALPKPGSNSFRAIQSAENAKMSDIGIIPVQSLDFHVAPLSWPFAADRRSEIEDYFTYLRRGKPKLWNGRVLLLREFNISDAALQGTLFETDYASFIAWRDWGHPDQEVRACFAMGALLSSDGAFLLGVMNTHTAGAGGIYFPGGMPEPRDIFFGRVDFDSNVRREICEETGLRLDGIRSDQWLVVVAEQRVALIKIFRFRKSATEMRASILDHLKNEALPELSDVHIVRDSSDFKPRMLPFVRAFLLHFWACDSER
jgi:hypothetical protein